MSSGVHLGPKAAPTTTESTANAHAATPQHSTTAATNSHSQPQSLPTLHHAAQTGDIKTLLELLPQGCDPSLANEVDAQGISALHWAAINNQLQPCRLLLDRGARVDAVGGDLSATPLHWAARNGHLYIAHLLLSRSADPSLVDSQSFNALHLAVHSSSALLVCYLLFTSQPIAVDTADTEGHTALHWACYQGDAISVDLLLRAGASVTRADNAGLTALHWAAVKGNAGCIKRLVEAGADQSAREAAGKTPRDMAIELKSLPAFIRGLTDAGLDDEGRTATPRFASRTASRAIFALPTLTLGLIFQTLSALPWYSALLLSGAEFFAMHHVISKVLLDMKGPQHSDRLTKSPYFSSIIIASLLWSTYVWLTRFVLQPSAGYTGTVWLCFAGIAVTSYNFYRAITLDPGHVPLAAGEDELKEQIEQLVEGGNFNGMNFCLPCLTRRPLRSKHSHATKRCTARFDHYCPWIWNDVGFNNHRQFLLFVGAMVVSIILFIRLAVGYYVNNAPPLEAAEANCVLPTPLCIAARHDTFALAVTSWLALQLSWTVILLGAQLWQVCRQMTTLEVSNVGRYGYLGGKPGVSAAAQQGLMDKVGPDSANHVHGPGCDHSSGAGAQKKKKGKASFLLKVLGLNRFTEGKAAEGLANAGRVANPFDLGLLANCRDFWTKGGELGVDYAQLYDVPEGGFARQRRRRAGEQQAAEGTRGARGTGYERVAMEEV